MKLTLLLLGVAPMMIVRAETILWQERRPGLSRSAVLISPDSFDDGHLETICRQALQREASRGFAQLQIVVDEKKPLPKPDHLTYEHWRRWHDLAAKSAGPVAEMTAMDGSAVLRIREKDGQVKMLVLAGKNPLLQEFGGSGLEILHFSFGPSAPYWSERVDIYAKTDNPLSMATGLSLWGALKAKFADVSVFLYVRTDGWFVYEPSFPFLDPFGTDLGPPIEKEYDAAPTLRCGVWSGEPTCKLE
jgi:hypothetical protein